MLTTEDIQDIRSLHDAGYRTQVIADLFKISQRRVQQIVEDPPSPEELDTANAELERIRAHRDDNVPRFAGFTGDSALFVAKLFRLPADDGDLFVDGCGIPRF